MAKEMSNLSAQEQERFEKKQRETADAARAQKEKEARLKALQKFENYDAIRKTCPSCDAEGVTEEKTEFKGITLQQCSICGFTWTAWQKE